MPNRAIRAQQRLNSKKLCQRRFPTPTQPKSKIYRQEREMDRRRLQIARGQLTESNGLALPSAGESTP